LKAKKESPSWYIMALVAYDANSDSDISDDEEIHDVASKPMLEIENSKETTKNQNGGHISDEEDDFFGDQSNEVFEDEQPDLLSLISQKLPNAKLNKSSAVSYIDDKEDVSDMPTKKDYGDKIEEPPSKKKKREGPVKITIPALTDLKEIEETAPKPTVKVGASKSGSGLFSILPPPKNQMIIGKKAVNVTSTIKPSPAGGGGQNLKPKGVRTVGLVPHRVANPVKPAKEKPKANENSDDSDDDDDYLGVNSGSYFPSAPTTTNSKYKKINSVPVASNMEKFINPVPVAPTLPVDNNFVSFNVEQDLGPAVAPYPPPAPTYASVSGSNELIDNEEAIMRLAGKQNKLREMKEDGANGGLNIVDIHGDDMKGDPRVWMTKALTEEQAPRPTGKGPKGLARTRHQITYLAHQAKERDWELKQEWAVARENRMASRNKYGFI